MQKNDQDTFLTPKGTELPLLRLHGKDYLEVKYRLVWFREEHPDWTIKTTILERTDKFSVARAEILNEQGRIIATGHKLEDRSGFPDFMEKSETSAVGRALAMIGYGTQFAPEMDEDERLADAPAYRKKVPPVKAAPTSSVVIKPKEQQASGPLEYLFQVAKERGWSREQLDTMAQNAYNVDSVVNLSASNIEKLKVGVASLTFDQAWQFFLDKTAAKPMPKQVGLQKADERPSLGDFNPDDIPV